jgi:uncharacterized protein (DUF2141 family)
LFTGNRIQLYFDEFIQLKDPAENIFMVPKDAKINCSLQKKVLTLEWEEPLKENTTYAIYFNNAVKDVTEDNATLFSYVFSTGSTIDTLTAAVYISDALSQGPVSDIIVGLYRTQDSLTPRYFAQSNKMGMAQFAYLASGTYAVKAFKDENRDLEIGTAEVQGFVSDSVRISNESTDTLLLSVFTPESEKLISKCEFKGPEVFELGVSSPLKEIDLSLNGLNVDPDQYRKVNNTTYRIFPKDSVFQNNLLVVSGGKKTDSSTVRITTGERSAPVTPLVISPRTLAPSSPVLLQFNTIIRELDTSKISLFKENDSVTKIEFSIIREKDLLKIYPKSSGKFQLKLEDGAVSGKSRAFSTAVEIREPKDLGNLIIVPDGFSGNLIVEVLKEKELIDSRFITASEPVRFEQLIPGEYAIRIVVDSNGNGFWDAGNLSTFLQPEEVINYGSTRVRANWDVSVPIKARK